MSNHLVSFDLILPQNDGEKTTYNVLPFSDKILCVEENEITNDLDDQWLEVEYYTDIVTPDGPTIANFLVSAIRQETMLIISAKIKNPYSDFFTKAWFVYVKILKTSALFSSRMNDEYSESNYLGGKFTAKIVNSVIYTQDAVLPWVSTKPTKKR
jgi:hypothetical protein